MMTVRARWRMLMLVVLPLLGVVWAIPPVMISVYGIALMVVCTWLTTRMRLICPRCGRSVFLRSVKLFQSEWAYTWFWVPSSCSICGQSFSVSAASELPTGDRPPEWAADQWRRPKVAIALFGCAVIAGVASLFSWQAGSRTGAVIGLVVGAGWLLVAAGVTERQ